MTPKLIFSLIALILAFTFTFFSPGIEFVDPVVVVVTTIAGFFGVTNWRTSYDQALIFFKSKTVWGAVIVVIPMLALIFVPILFSVAIPEIWKTVIMWIVTGGGALTLYGIFDATKNENRIR